MIDPYPLPDAEPSYAAVSIATVVFGMLCFWIGLACYLFSGIF